MAADCRLWRTRMSLIVNLSNASVLLEQALQPISAALDDSVIAAHERVQFGVSRQAVAHCSLKLIFENLGRLIDASLGSHTLQYPCAPSSRDGKCRD